jgi:hypothetical protein
MSDILVFLKNPDDEEKFTFFSFDLPLKKACVRKKNKYFLMAHYFL